MKKKLLIIDDDQNILDSLMRTLQGGDFDLLTCKDSLKALELVKSESPPVIITDLKMPGMDGLTILGTRQNLQPPYSGDRYYWTWLH